jgi:hypothetical protein
MSRNGRKGEVEAVGRRTPKSDRLGDVCREACLSWLRVGVPHCAAGASAPFSGGLWTLPSKVPCRAAPVAGSPQRRDALRSAEGRGTFPAGNAPGTPPGGGLWAGRFCPAPAGRWNHPMVA